MTFTTYLPTHYNNFRPVPDSVFDAVLDRLLDMFGGYTLDSPSFGAWKDPTTGQVYREEVRRLTFSVEHKRADAVRPCILWIKELLRQESMYLAQSSDPVEFV